MGNVSDIINALDRIGYRGMLIHELTNILAQQPPMIPIIGYDEDAGGPKYINGIRVDTSGKKPVLFLYFSEVPKANSDIYRDQSYDEKIAEQKNKALDMAEASKKHMSPLE